MRRQIVAATFALAGLTISQSALALGLMQAYEAALQYDGTYRAAIYQNEAGQQREKLGKSHIMPSLSASYSFNRVDSRVEFTNTQQTTTDDRDYDSKNAVIQARQPIFNKESWSKYELGKLETKISNMELAMNKQLLIERFFAAFAEANYAQDLLTLAKTEQAAYENQEISNKQLFALGEGTKTDLIESQAEKQIAAAGVIEAENHVMNTQVTLQNIIGVDTKQLDQLDKDFNQLDLSNDAFEAWAETAQANNPELMAYQLKIDLATEEVKQYQAGHYPQLDAVASISKSSSDSVATFNQDIFSKSIGLQLNIPIYTGGAVTAQVLEAKANLKKAEAERDNKKREIELEIRQQLNTLKSSVLKINALAQSVESAELLVEATQKSILAGFRTNQDVLDARKQLYTAKRDWSIARYNYLVAYVRLKKAAGTLSDNDMMVIAQHFHP